MRRRFADSYRGRRRLIAVAAVLCAVAAWVVVQPPPAQAAVWYWYRPSIPMNPWPDHPNPPYWCTGGWGIRLNSTGAPYFLTAGHCFARDQFVYPNTGINALGWVSARLDYFGGRDTELVHPNVGVDGLQEIPGVGKVVGHVGNGYLTTAGGGIAIRGANTGLDYGVIVGGWRNWNWPPDTVPENDGRVACGNYDSQGGDSGAPIFIHYGNQVYAAGVHVGRWQRLVNGQVVEDYGCFMTIDDLLALWAAWLPTFLPGTQAAERVPPDLGSPGKSEQLTVVGGGVAILE